MGGAISPINNYSSDDPDLQDCNARLKLLRLALEYNQWVRISDWAAKQKTAKSTLETLRYHRKVLTCIANKDNENIYKPGVIKWVPFGYMMCTYGKTVPPVQIKLVCGMDILKSIATPGLWTDDEVSKDATSLSTYAHNQILHDNASFQIAELFMQYGLVVIDEEGQNINRFIYDSDILSKYIVTTLAHHQA